MSVIWEVNVRLTKVVKGPVEGPAHRFLNGTTASEYETQEAAQAAYVDAIKQLGREK